MKQPLFTLLFAFGILTALAAAPEPMMAAPTEALPKQKVVSLEVIPGKIVLDGKFAAAQVLVSAKLQSGEFADVTRLAKVLAFDVSGSVAERRLDWLKLGVLSLLFASMTFTTLMFARASFGAASLMI